MAILLSFFIISAISGSTGKSIFLDLQKIVQDHTTNDDRAGSVFSIQYCTTCLLAETLEPWFQDTYGQVSTAHLHFLCTTFSV